MILQEKFFEISQKTLYFMQLNILKLLMKEFLLSFKEKLKSNMILINRKIIERNKIIKKRKRKRKTKRIRRIRLKRQIRLKFRIKLMKIKIPL
jgi:hypothetical protein